MDQDKQHRWAVLVISVAFAVYDRVEIHPAMWHRWQWKTCARAAEWFGQRALDSEAAYYEEVKQ